MAVSGSDKYDRMERGVGDGQPLLNTRAKCPTSLRIITAIVLIIFAVLSFLYANSKSESRTLSRSERFNTELLKWTSMVGALALVVNDNPDRRDLAKILMGLGLAGIGAGVQDQIGHSRFTEGWGEPVGDVIGCAFCAMGAMLVISSRNF